MLTAKQKADKLRAQEMINALKAQGLEIPDPGEKKIRPGTRIKPNKSKSLVSQNSSETSFFIIIIIIIYFFFFLVFLNEINKCLILRRGV